MRVFLMIHLTLITVIDPSPPMEAVASPTAMTLLLITSREPVTHISHLPVISKLSTQTNSLNTLVLMEVMTLSFLKTLKSMTTDGVVSHTLKRVLRPMVHHMTQPTA